MPTILIKDLPESVDLDRQAMAAITGGARLQGRQPGSPPGVSRTGRIFHYPGTPGLAISQPVSRPVSQPQAGPGEKRRGGK